MTELTSYKQICAAMDDVANWSLANKDHPKIELITLEMNLLLVLTKRLHKHRINEMLKEMMNRMGCIIPQNILIEQIKKSPEGKWWDWDNGSMLCAEDRDLLPNIEICLECIESYRRDK